MAHRVRNQLFAQIPVRARQVDLFVTLYNEIRPHETLGFRVPIDLYREG